MASEYSYKFTERAEQDFDEILNYITEELKNPNAAVKLGRKIFEHIEAVCVYPETGMLVDNEYLSDKQVRRILVDNYIVYYKPIAAEETIYILRIVYGYRNLDTIVRTIGQK